MMQWRGDVASKEISLGFHSYQLVYFTGDKSDLTYIYMIKTCGFFILDRLLTTKSFIRVAPRVSSENLVRFVFMYIVASQIDLLIC